MRKTFEYIRRKWIIAKRQLNRQLSIVNCQFVRPLSIVLMLGATSCEKEILDNGQAAGIALADGQFIVEYSGEPQTRAISENLSKGARINSLTYLLYQDAGTGGMANATLVKRREIPDLDGHEESWPLTRENMTWEQRKALKDTLSVGNTYYAVFVANADALLWDDTSPLKNADLPTAEGDPAPTYSAAYLQLSSEKPFDDYNMFYLATETIDGTTASREHPQDCPITLRRIVTRTDWWFERLPEFTENPEAPDEWKEDKEVVAYANSLMQPILSTCWEHIGESIQEETEEFLTAMRDYFQQKGEELWETEHEGETPSSPHPVATPYDGYVEALEKMIDALATSNYVSDLLNANDAALSVNLLTELRNLCLANTAIMSEWKQSWREGNEYARLVYVADARADRIYLDRTTQHADGTTQDGVEDKSPYLAIDCLREVYDMDGNTYDGFHFVGLANPEMNQIAKVELYKDKEAATTPYETLEVPDAYDHTGQGINEWYRINYRPLAELVWVEGWTAVFSKVIACDLSTALPFAADGSQEDLKEAMNTAMTEAANGLFSDYGSSLEAIRLTIDLPDLSEATVLKGNNSWEIRAVN